MAKGAWAAAAWPAAKLASQWSSTVVQPRDIDPYGLLSDGDEGETKSGVIPYNPAILENGRI